MQREDGRDFDSDGFDFQNLFGKVLTINSMNVKLLNYFDYDERKPRFNDVQSLLRVIHLTVIGCTFCTDVYTVCILKACVLFSVVKFFINTYTSSK